MLCNKSAFCERKNTQMPVFFSENKDKMTADKDPVTPNISFPFCPSTTFFQLCTILSSADATEDIKSIKA